MGWLLPYPLMLWRVCALPVMRRGWCSSEGGGRGVPPVGMEGSWSSGASFPQAPCGLEGVPVMGDIAIGVRSPLLVISSLGINCRAQVRRLTSRFHRNKQMMAVPHFRLPCWGLQICQFPLSRPYHEVATLTLRPGITHPDSEYIPPILGFDLSSWEYVRPGWGGVIS